MESPSEKLNQKIYNIEIENKQKNCNKFLVIKIYPI